MSPTRILGPDATVVTVACDSGIKYLSTKLYRSKPFELKQRPEAGRHSTEVDDAVG